MASTYGTIANSGKNDFEKFMEDMNKIGGYDSNRETPSSWTGTTKPVDKPTGSSTTDTANQGTVTNYGSNPDYGRVDRLIDKKKEIAIENRNWTQYRNDLNNAAQRGREDIARGDALEAQRYNRNEARNDRFQGWADRARAQNNINADRLAQRQKDREDRRLARSAQKSQASLKRAELALMSEKNNAEIAALNAANQWKGVEAMTSLASTALSANLQREQLAQQKERDKWNVIGAIYS